MGIDRDTVRRPLQSDQIEALTPEGQGHQLVLYGDSCSGVPGAPHEASHARVNAVVARLAPPPEFIVYTGDEVIGLTADESELRAQWRHWLDQEMAWLDREAIPLYHATGNHTTYDAMSERVFADVLPWLPRNGPPDQQGLSYFVRRDDLLIVFVHTAWTGLGGEGHVETVWLEQTLRLNHDATWKLVVGHHPVFPVNGFSGRCQREIAAEHAGAFWRILVGHGVLAYVCSHILAFDVQVHEGVLQITTAGAGTAHRMPEDVEYLHCVQAALDRRGLRYQVLDDHGQVRERLSWPPELPRSNEWRPLSPGAQAAPRQGALVAWRFAGHAAPEGAGTPQTLVAAWSDGVALAPLWIGLTGRDQRLTVMIGPSPGRSPHYWFGPGFETGSPFDFHVALHADMGPGGILWRQSDAAPWSSLQGASPWGVERLVWPDRWSVGHGKGGASDTPFRGRDLAVRSFVTL
jgi:Calcineurin-like phosphoesterase